MVKAPTFRDQDNFGPTDQCDWRVKDKIVCGCMRSCKERDILATGQWKSILDFYTIIQVG